MFGGETDLKTMRSRRRLGMFAATLPGVALAALGITWWRSDVRILSEGLEDEAAKAANAGIPTNAAQLHAKLATLRGTNAAPYFLGAIRELDRHPIPKLIRKSGTRSALSPRPLPANRRSQILRWGREYRTGIASLERGSRCEILVFKRSWEEGVNLLMVEPQRLHHALGGLLSKAAAEHDSGDLRGSLATLDLVARCAALLRFEPDTLGHHIRGSIEAHLFEELERILAAHGGKEWVLESVRRIAISLGPPSNLRWAAQSLPVSVESALEATWRGSEGDFEPDLTGAILDAVADPDSPRVLQLADVRRASHTVWLRRQRYAHQIFPEDDGDAEGILRASQELESRYASTSGLHTKGLWFASGFGPAQAQLIAGQVARRRILALGIELLEGRRRTGSLLPTLPSRGALTQDPFTGRPLTYRRIAGGFALYSVGLDRVDDGGICNSDASSKRDIGLVIARPPSQPPRPH